MEEDSAFASFMSSISNAQLRIIGPELIFGSLYDKIGYNKIENEMFRHLVITRLFHPGSKLKTIDYLYRYQGVEYSISKIYRFLDTLCFRSEHKNAQTTNNDEAKEKKEKEELRSLVENISFAHTKQVLGGEISVVFYDMTTLYFEAADEDDLRKTGYSKDGKHHCPQILLGLLVGLGGNPVGYDIFEGNIYEGNTFIPFVERVEKKYKIDKPIIVADSGLLSKRNINYFTEKGYKFIIGGRPKNESQYLKQQIIDSNLQFGDIKVFHKGDNLRLIISKTENRAKKYAFNRQKGLARLKKKVRTGKLTKSHINERGYNKYLRMEGEISVVIDKDKFFQDAVWDGIKGFVTNTQLKEEEVIAAYTNLWYIEQTFRMSVIKLPHSKILKTQILKMAQEQQELYDMVKKFCEIVC